MSGGHCTLDKHNGELQMVEVVYDLDLLHSTFLHTSIFIYELFLIEHFIYTVYCIFTLNTVAPLWCMKITLLDVYLLHCHLCILHFMINIILVIEDPFDVISH